MAHKSTGSDSSGRLPMTTKGGHGTVLRDLLSSVAPQWVESHLHPHDSSSSTSTSLGRHGRGSRRIRSWIIHNKDKNNGGDNSLHFKDVEESDDDFAHDIYNHDYDTRTNTTMQMLTSDETESVREEEESAVEMLTALMGDGFDPEVVRRVLRKYDGNVDKAAGALVEGERGEEMITGPLPQQQQQLPMGTGHQIQSQGWPAIVGPATSASSSSWSIGTPGSTQTQKTAGGPLGVASQTPPHTVGGRPNTPVIDLTLDDDPDLQRAVQESMNTMRTSASYAPSYSTGTGFQSLSQVYGPSERETEMQSTMMQLQQQQHQREGPMFGPSERPSDPNWAVIPSHQTESNDANYLQNLNRAIEASLETMGDSDALEPFPVEQQLRRDGCPVVLRPSMHTMVYAASILQGLFYVPQVRVRMACWRPPIPANEDEVAPPMNGPDFTMWALSEIFTHMDLARLCDLNVDKRLPAFNIEPWDKPAQPPGELSRKFFARLSVTLERAFIDQFARDSQPLPKPRLLHFQYGSGISEPGELLQETSIVPIDVNGGESNDLIGRLSAQLSKPLSEPGRQSVIFEPSEMVAFELVRSSSTPSTSTNGLNRKAFTYPKSIYLDQFLRENVELAQGKREQRREMLEEVQRLVLHKKTLTHFDGKDTLKDLRSSIFYFENVADAKDDLERDNVIQATTRKLKGILATIEEGVKAIDEKVDTLRTQAETLLDCEELQRFKYDLRVVFVHDGLYGRKHLYSYVHDKCCWWKIADSLIEKVPEEVVLNDQAGLHLGAGPYLLFYSRTMENESPALPLPWMDDIKDDVRMANREFLSQLPPELVADIVIEEISLPSVSPMAKHDVAGEGMDMSP